ERGRSSLGARIPAGRDGTSLSFRATHASRGPEFPIEPGRVDQPRPGSRGADRGPQGELIQLDAVVRLKPRVGSAWATEPHFGLRARVSRIRRGAGFGRS